jgi:chromosome segregation ATPase
MATDLYEIQDLNCPVCGKLLTSDEYNHAIEEIRLKVGQDYQEQIKRERSEFEEQIQNERKLFQGKTDSINRNHNEHLQVLRDQLAASYSQQFENMKKNYEDLDLQRQRNSKESLNDKIAEYKQKTSELNMQVVVLQQESLEIKENAFSDARVELQRELHSRDIEIRERDEQILRCKGTIEELKEQMSKTQPELKGEVGEQKLLEDLREAFPEDQFSRQTRGISEGDIIQHIRTASGALLKMMAFTLHIIISFIEIIHKNRIAVS